MKKMHLRMLSGHGRRPTHEIETRTNKVKEKGKKGKKERKGKVRKKEKEV